MFGIRVWTLGLWNSRSSTIGGFWDLNVCLGARKSEDAETISRICYLLHSSKFVLHMLWRADDGLVWHKRAEAGHSMKKHKFILCPLSRLPSPPPNPPSIYTLSSPASPIPPQGQALRSDLWPASDGMSILGMEGGFTINKFKEFWVEDLGSRVWEFRVGPRV